LKTGFLNRLQHKALQSEIVATRLTSAVDPDDEPARRSRHSGGGSRHFHRGGAPGRLRAAFFARWRSRSQSRRRIADLRTTNRPDACLRKSLANKNQNRAK